MQACSVPQILPHLLTWTITRKEGFGDDLLVERLGNVLLHTSGFLYFIPLKSLSCLLSLATQQLALGKGLSYQTRLDVRSVWWYVKAGKQKCS